MVPAVVVVVVVVVVFALTRRQSLIRGHRSGYSRFGLAEYSRGKLKTHRQQCTYLEKDLHRYDSLKMFL